MDLILLERVENLGDLGDRVTVKPGYARNFLIPKGKATAATEANLKEFEAHRAELERRAMTSLKDAEARREKLTDTVVTIAAKTGNEGRLYGSVGPAEIAEALSNSGVAVEKREVILHQGPLREVGEYDVTVRLHSDVETMVRVNVAAE